MRRFSLYTRKGVYYVRWYDPKTKKRTCGKSTGQTDKNAALAQVAYWSKYGFEESSGPRTVDEYLEVKTTIAGIRSAPLTRTDARAIVDVLTDRGLLDPPQSAKRVPLLLPFLRSFWQYDTSEYVKEKLAYGQTIGRRHCLETLKRLHHWERFFSPDVRLSDVTREDLKTFQLSLRETLAPKTANEVLRAGTVPLGWAADRGMIGVNPSLGLRKFSGGERKRGILTDDEVKRLFAVPWYDERARVGALVALTCGLRAGEISAIRREDIGEDRLFVRHSWSFADGLKAPKNGETREVPLLPAVREELLRLADTCPYGPAGFPFYHFKEPGRPCDIETFRKGLLLALRELGWTPEQIAERSITFHSFRHQYAASLADRTDMRTVQLGTGHKSGVMAEHYANHAQEQHFRDASAAVASAFENVVPFRDPRKESAV